MQVQLKRINYPLNMSFRVLIVICDDLSCLWGLAGRGEVIEALFLWIRVSAAHTRELMIFYPNILSIQ